MGGYRVSIHHSDDLQTTCFGTAAVGPSSFGKNATATPPGARSCGSSSTSVRVRDVHVQQGGSRCQHSEEELDATCGDGIDGGWCSRVTAGELGSGSGEGPRRDAHDLAHKRRNKPVIWTSLHWRASRPADHE